MYILQGHLIEGQVVHPTSRANHRHVLLLDHPLHRGTPLIRNRQPPSDHHRVE